MQALAVTFSSAPLAPMQPEAVATNTQVMGPMIVVVIFFVILLVGVYIIRAKRMRKNENPPYVA